jgi:hypothetical protein
MSFGQVPSCQRNAGPDSIAFVCGASKRVAGLAKLLRGSVGEVAVSDSVAGIGDWSRHAMVVVHYDALSAAEQDELMASQRALARPPTLLLLSEHEAERDLAKLFGARILTNMLVLNETGFEISDLLVTVQKIRRGEIFGLEKYFAWGMEPRVIWVRSSVEKTAVLDAIADYLAGLSVPARLAGSIRAVADEFLANAIYNAPVDAAGLPRFASRPRTVPVFLDPAEAIEVRFCCDGRRFGISTTDPFGSLVPARMLDSLAKAYRRGEDQVSENSGGAGLGFYEILVSLSHFVVNIHPGVRTEMIGLVDVRGAYRTFASAGKSFNVFTRENG